MNDLHIFTDGEELTVTFFRQPVIRGRSYLSNGDVGYPDEGGELEFKIENEAGEDVTYRLPSDYYDMIRNQITNHKSKT